MPLEFFRLRFHFEALDALQFLTGTAANTIRGALGNVLRRVACAPRCHEAQHDAECAYVRFFEPRARSNGPSGFAQRPRPFVLRAHHLGARGFERGEHFSFDMHVFDLTNPVAPYLVEALSRFADEGLGRGRRRVRLYGVEQLGLENGEGRMVWGTGQPVPVLEPCTVTLAPDRMRARAARLRFVTPTELKFQNALADRPDFGVLFARIRDRISALGGFYGRGPLDVDFRAMGERASRICMTRCDLHRQHAERRSSRTGQVHPLGGFTGEAEYRGDLAEFLPFLRAAGWTGVGRQTVWGKGEIQVCEVDAAP